MSDVPPNAAATKYLRRRLWRRVICACGMTVIIASLIASHAGMLGRSGDDFSLFNHHSFLVTGVSSGDVMTIQATDGTTQTVKLLGIVAPTGTEKGATQARDFLSDLALNYQVTLLLQSPQARGDRGELLAYPFVDRDNLSVELTRAGMVYADRRDTQLMGGLIDPAEAEARKKNRGMWQDLKFNQMPAWRQTWLRQFQQIAHSTK